MSEKLYAERDIEGDGLRELYMRHLDRMTREGLHDKSAIAAELAWRDSESARLKKSLDRTIEWSNERWEIIRLYVERYCPEMLDDFCAMIANGAATVTSADRAEASAGVLAITAKLVELEAVWSKCDVRYWPPDNTYPVEHNPHAGKDSREIIVRHLAAALARAGGDKE
jgi:hypothetical protein